jgi:hypothetical protein
MTGNRRKPRLNCERCWQRPSATRSPKQSGSPRPSEPSPRKPSPRLRAVPVLCRQIRAGRSEVATNDVVVVAFIVDRGRHPQFVSASCSRHPTSRISRSKLGRSGTPRSRLPSGLPRTMPSPAPGGLPRMNPRRHSCNRPDVSRDRSGKPNPIGHRLWARQQRRVRSTPIRNAIANDWMGASHVKALTGRCEINAANWGKLAATRS